MNFQSILLDAIESSEVNVIDILNAVSSHPNYENINPQVSNVFMGKSYVSKQLSKSKDRKYI
ncbi:MAG: hypothetical protein GON13_00945 [Nanoarchaeota archaeon]|nr:hypothetical protein [Nanoarchaeota archaeon]